MYTWNYEENILEFAITYFVESSLQSLVPSFNRLRAGGKISLAFFKSNKLKKLFGKIIIFYAVIFRKSISILCFYDILNYSELFDIELTNIKILKAYTMYVQSFYLCTINQFSYTYFMSIWNIPIGNCINLFFWNIIFEINSCKLYTNS